MFLIMIFDCPANACIVIIRDSTIQFNLMYPVKMNINDSFYLSYSRDFVIFVFNLER